MLPMTKQLNKVTARPVPAPARISTRRQELVVGKRRQEFGRPELLFFRCFGLCCGSRHTRPTVLNRAIDRRAICGFQPVFQVPYLMWKNVHSRLVAVIRIYRSGGAQHCNLPFALLQQFFRSGLNAGLQPCHHPPRQSGRNRVQELQRDFPGPSQNEPVQNSPELCAAGMQVACNCA